MSIHERIERKLNAGLSPLQLRIIDESHRHAGHAGARSGPGHAQDEGETHFRVEVVADIFTGKSRVARQQMVYALLAAELADRVHALSLSTLTPAEAAGQKA